ncbi:MAG TPA: NAD(P)H-dependent oxidoreductase [Beijerinckiaceae bacterium]|jgi:putative NADPH-quinone reductase
MARVLVIQGHPDPAGGRFCHALADAYASGARNAGHEVRRLEIAALDLPLLRTQADFETGEPPPAAREAQAAIAWAEHVTLVFPLWLGGAPALVHAFLEQTLRPNFAFRYEKAGAVALLKGRSARLIVTMGMPAFVYRSGSSPTG